MGNGLCHFHELSNSWTMLPGANENINIIAYLLFKSTKSYLLVLFMSQAPVALIRKDLSRSSQISEARIMSQISSAESPLTVSLISTRILLIG